MKEVVKGKIEKERVREKERMREKKNNVDKDLLDHLMTFPLHSMDPNYLQIHLGAPAD